MSVCPHNWAGGPSFLQAGAFGCLGNPHGPSRQGSGTLAVHMHTSPAHAHCAMQCLLAVAVVHRDQLQAKELQRVTLAQQLRRLQKTTQTLRKGARWGSGQGRGYPVRAPLKRQCCTSWGLCLPCRASSEHVRTCMRRAAFLGTPAPGGPKSESEAPGFSTPAPGKGTPGPDAGDTTPAASPAPFAGYGATPQGPASGKQATPSARCGWSRGHPHLHASAAQPHVAGTPQRLVLE